MTRDAATRRRLLRLSGLALAVGLGGCSIPGGGGDGEDGGGNGGEGESGGGEDDGEEGGGDDGEGEDDERRRIDPRVEDDAP